MGCFLCCILMPPVKNKSVTISIFGSILLISVFLVVFLVSSWCLGKRSEQPRGPREARGSGQGGQCNPLPDRVLPQTSFQEAQEEGNLWRL